MAIRRYAEGTTVSVENTIAEMRMLLRKHNVDEFATYEGRSKVVVQFTLKGHPYRFDVAEPTSEWADGETSLLPHYRTYDSTIENIKGREWKRRWRARLLWLKATLEFAYGEGDIPLSHVLAAFAVLEDGRTLGQALETGSIPLLAAG